MAIIFIMYLIVTFVLLVLSKSEQLPNIIWSYWDSGFESNKDAKAFDFHRRQTLKGWEVIMLNKTTVIPYLQRIPYYKHDIDKIDYYLVQTKSDYIRLLLMSYYGGVWLDSSAIFVEDFSWLKLKRLKDNPQVLNKYGEEPDILLFTNQRHGSREEYFDKQSQRTFMISPGYQIWFIAAKPNSTFMRIYLDEYKKALEYKSQIVIGNSYSNDIIRQNNLQVGYLIQNFYLCTLQMFQFLIQMKQKQLDQVSKSKNISRTLAVWYYKIWHIKSENGPFSIFKTVRSQQTFPLVKYSREQLRILDMKINYLIKLTNIDRGLLQRYKYHHSNNEKFQQMFKTLQNLQFYNIQNYLCPEQFAVSTQSVLYSYIYKNSPDKVDLPLTKNRYRPNSQCSNIIRFTSLAKKNNFTLIYQEILKFQLKIIILLVLLTKYVKGKVKEQEQRLNPYGQQVFKFQQFDEYGENQ